jgi:hypothetical protein
VLFDSEPVAQGHHTQVARSQEEPPSLTSDDRDHRTEAPGDLRADETDRTIRSLPCIATAGMSRVFRLFQTEYRGRVRRGRDLTIKAASTSKGSPRHPADALEAGTARHAARPHRGRLEQQAPDRLGCQFGASTLVRQSWQPSGEPSTGNIKPCKTCYTVRFTSFI